MPIILSFFMLRFCSSVFLRSRKKWKRLSSGLFQFPQIQTSMFCSILIGNCWQSFAFVCFHSFKSDSANNFVMHCRYCPTFTNLCSFDVVICGRAHQGFGWVGEWANSGSVKAPLSHSLNIFEPQSKRLNPILTVFSVLQS